MVRRWVLIGGMMLGLSALFVVPGLSEARGYRGYAYGGGYWGGGYWGGYHGGYGPGYYGGYRRHVYYPGYYYGGYSPYYAYGPSYYSYYPGYAGVTYNAPAVNYYSAEVPTTSYQAFYPSEESASASQDGNRVHLNVMVPADAEVWIEGQKTTKQGTTREFVSPPLSGDGRFVYTVRARWEADGRAVDRTRQVKVRPGETATVDFRSARSDDRRDLGGADSGRDDLDRSRDERRDRIRDDERGAIRSRDDGLRDRTGTNGAIRGTGDRTGTGNTGTGAGAGNPGIGTRNGESTSNPATNRDSGGRSGSTSGVPPTASPGGTNPGGAGSGSSPR